MRSSEKAQGKAGRIALSLLSMDLVILDELGCKRSIDRALAPSAGY
jgi:hypothetical protein